MATKYKQQSDGRYRTKVWDGTYKDGKKHYIFLQSNKSSKDLERIVTEYENKRDGGKIVVQKNISLKDYAMEWAKIEKGLSETATKEMYDKIIKVHLKPYDVTFEYFDRKLVQSIINDYADKPRTCQMIVMTLKQISKAAERDKLIVSGKTNEIFDKLQKPKYKSKEKKPLTDEQCKIVENILKSSVLPPKCSLFLLVIYFCGLRREEVLALKYDDFKIGCINVNKALFMGKTKEEIKVPKSERGYRKVPMPQAGKELLVKLMDKIEPNDEGYMFYTKDGKLMTRNAYDKMWARIKKVLGFECSAHVFRHTYCTRLCYESYKNRTISLKQIAKILGDTEKMVTDVYSHLIEENEQTSDAINSVFGNHLATNNRKKRYKVG